MSETTAVPIAPVKRAWLVWLSLGVGAAAVAGVALAYAGTASTVGGECAVAKFPDRKAPRVVTPSGLVFQTVRAGEGDKPTDADVGLVSYKGSLLNGTVFDQNPRAPLPVKGMIPGFSEALKLMQRGGSYRFCLPSALGYGAKAIGPIPANSTLMFDVEMLDFKSEAELQAQMQSMQAQQQSQGALPPGATPLPR